MHAFAEFDMLDYLSSHDEKIKSRVEGESEDYILNVNEKTYVEYLADEFVISPMSLNFDSIFVSSREESIPAYKFPSGGFFVNSTSSYKKPVITFHIPYTGNGWDLIRYRPNPFISWTTEVFLESNCVCFEIINFYDNNSEMLKRESDEIIKSLKIQAGHQLDQIKNYNEQLKAKIQQQITKRKSSILKLKESLQSLGYPVKEQVGMAKTYAIPLPQKRDKIKPVLIPGTQQLDPTLDNSSYLEILQIINEAGKMIEKYPSSFIDKDEEQLRDSFLVTLKPFFDSSVTGETFNKNGKTDILLSYKSNNIFVGECKIWHGKKEYFEAINQLLSYLTWRDSKTALIIFVRNKDFSSVLETVKNETSQHHNFTKFNGNNDESWFNYIFHFPTDKSRNLRLAILLYHLPT